MTTAFAAGRRIKLKRQTSGGAIAALMPKLMSSLSLPDISISHNLHSRIGVRDLSELNSPDQMTEKYDEIKVKLMICAKPFSFLSLGNQPSLSQSQ